MRLGFIGLGNMGAPMARGLLRAGHRVTVHNRTRAKADALQGDGALVADSPAEAARDADAVITMLADDATVERAVFGQNGLLDAMPGGAVHISCSTTSVALSRRLTEAHSKGGRRFLAAPVLGRPEAAVAGKLVVLAGGQDGTIARCRPVLEVIGQRVVVVAADPVGANLVKLSCNFMIASVIESLSEAISLARKGGIDPTTYLDLLTSTLFDAPVYRTYGELIVQQKWQPAGFKLPLGLKDVRLAMAAGDLHGVPLPFASVIRDHYLALLANGGEDLDWSALGKLAAENAGLTSQAA
jgi:3-hydroxyisobutyrate dehydrogenase-like beta-hydroxyacid dehydrogenase